jgi:hypothetical protein
METLRPLLLGIDIDIDLRKQKSKHLGAYLLSSPRIEETVFAKSYFLF